MTEEQIVQLLDACTALAHQVNLLEGSHERLKTRVTELEAEVAAARVDYYGYGRKTLVERLDADFKTARDRFDSDG